MFKPALDDEKEYKANDKSGVYETIQKFAHQFESGWHEAEFLQLGFDPEKIKEIVFVGMGASNLAGKIIQALSPYLLKVPFEVVTNYRLPNYVSKSTLVILSSYSGNTHEVLSCGTDAKKRGSKVIVITTGGQLQKMAIDEKWPIALLDAKFNISQAPRMGIMLSLGAVISLISRFNTSASQFIDLNDFIRTIEKSVAAGDKNRDSKTNAGKSLALRHQHQGVIFVSANHLSGVSESVKNFVNESSKTFSMSLSIPDMNHHFLDGLTYPTSLKDNLKFIIINSALYPQVIQKRIQATQETLSKLKYQVTIVKPESENAISQVLESLVFFIMFSYYLSIANKVDPSTNPWVDFFKKQL